jgi:hypothetical protein
MKTINLKMSTVCVESKYRYCLTCLEIVNPSMDIFDYHLDDSITESHVKCGCEYFNQFNTMFLSKHEYRERKINKICQREQ